jgi:hypothetical protein
MSLSSRRGTLRNDRGNDLKVHGVPLRGVGVKAEGFLAELIMTSAKIMKNTSSFGTEKNTLSFGTRKNTFSAPDKKQPENLQKHSVLRSDKLDCERLTFTTAIACGTKEHRGIDSLISF